MEWQDFFYMVMINNIQKPYHTPVNMLPSDILTLIAQSLDYKSIARLLQTSKESHSQLTPLFLTKSHPHAVAYIAYRLLQTHKTQSQTGQFVLRDIYDQTFRYIGRNTIDSFGPVLLFSVTTDKHSTTITVLSRSGSAAICKKNNSAFCHIMGTISIIIKPSLHRPMHEGSIQIILNNDTMENITTHYTADPEIILRLCPMEVLPSKHSLRSACVIWGFPLLCR